jgi:hypothetical protein
VFAVCCATRAEWGRAGAEVTKSKRDAADEIAQRWIPDDWGVKREGLAEQIRAYGDALLEKAKQVIVAKQFAYSSEPPHQRLVDRDPLGSVSEVRLFSAAIDALKSGGGR